VDDRLFAVSMVAIVLLCVMDVVTTFSGISISRRHCRVYEANPVVRQMLAERPLDWVAIKIGGGCIIAVCLYLARKLARMYGLRTMDSICTAVTILLLIWGTIVVVNNILLSTVCLLLP